MRQALANLFARVAQRLRPKALPALLGGRNWSGTGFVDAYKRNREPTPNELMAELKNTAWTCISINSAVCANYPPRLYVATHDSQPEPKCLTKALGPKTEQYLRDSKHLPPRFTKAASLREVLDHPLLRLFEQVNPVHNQFDLWELTTLYQEVHGSCYWALEDDAFGVPRSIWILPTQNVTPRRRPDSPNIVDYYEYRVGSRVETFTPAEVIHFRYPDPRDPYTSGLSPLRAAYEQVVLASEYHAFRKAVWENGALPSAIVSPDDVLGEDERDRLEAEWNQKYRRGGAGRILVAESAMRVAVLSHSVGDLATLAEYGATKADNANNAANVSTQNYVS